ncbi:hypothetical protein ACQEDT_21320 [Agrobacterium pusense]|uniref:hypothetical protein n=1 Tax=Agrobacterium pusense TaxID=648995 RepID=UPI003D0DBA87
MADAIAQHGGIGFTLVPDVKAPWVSIQDVAGFAAKEFDTPPDEHRSVKQLGIDYTMTEIAGMIGRALGRESDRKVETVLREGFGTLDRWVHDKNTAAAMNDGRVKFRGDRPALPTTMEDFIKDTRKPLVEKARTEGLKPQTFLTWSSQR